MIIAEAAVLVVVLLLYYLVIRVIISSISRKRYIENELPLIQDKIDQDKEKAHNDRVRKRVTQDKKFIRNYYVVHCGENKHLDGLLENHFKSLSKNRQRYEKATGENLCEWFGLIGQQMEIMKGQTPESKNKTQVERLRMCNVINNDYEAKFRFLSSS